MAAKEYRKHHKGRNKGVESRGCSLAFGSFGLKANGYCRLTEKQIDAARKSAMRPIKGLCTMWQRVFPDIIVTRKPQEVRMGSGKGAVDHKIFRLRPGRVILEIAGVSEQQARDALALAAAKLPVATEFVAKRGRLVLNV